MFRYNNTLKQNMLVHLLKEGDHRSFSEMCDLFEKQKSLRTVGHKTVRNAPLLESDRTRLGVVSKYLAKAETAEREGKSRNRRIDRTRKHAELIDCFIDRFIDRRSAGRSNPVSIIRLHWKHYLLSFDGLEVSRIGQPLPVRCIDGRRCLV